MFDMNSLNKLTDEVPEDMKEELKKKAMEKLGLSNSDSGKSPEEAAAPSGQDQTQPVGTPNEQVTNSEQSESTDEDKPDAA